MRLRPHLLSALFAFYIERSNARLAHYPKCSGLGDRLLRHGQQRQTGH